MLLALGDAPRVRLGLAVAHEPDLDGRRAAPAVFGASADAARARRPGGTRGGSDSRCGEMRPCCCRGSTLLVSRSWRVDRGRATGSGACAGPGRARPPGATRRGRRGDRGWRGPARGSGGRGRPAWTRWSCLERGGAVPSRGLRGGPRPGAAARGTLQFGAGRTPPRAARGPPGRAPTRSAPSAAAGSSRPTAMKRKTRDRPRGRNGPRPRAAGTRGCPRRPSSGGVAGTWPGAGGRARLPRPRAQMPTPRGCCVGIAG